MLDRKSLSRMPRARAGLFFNSGCCLAMISSTIGSSCSITLVYAAVLPAASALSAALISPSALAQRA